MLENRERLSERKVGEGGNLSLFVGATTRTHLSVRVTTVTCGTKNG